MFDPHKIPSFFLPPSPIERRKSECRRISGSNRSGGSVSSAEEVRIDPAVTVIPTPPASPSFLFRNAVLLHVSPDSVAETAGLHEHGGSQDSGGVENRQYENLG